MISIAICDDNINFLVNDLKRSLITAAQKAKQNISIKYFSNGLDLLNEFKSGEIADIVILDIEMPLINGKDLAQKLRSIDRSFFLIFISTYAYEVFDTIKYHINAFIPKSEDPSVYIPELTRVITEYTKKVSEYELLKVYKNGELVTIKIALNNILGFYMANRFIYAKTLSEEYILQEDIFKKIKDNYTVKGFIECSRNYIINLRNVKEIKQDKIVFNNDETFPLSRRRLKPVLEAFNNSLMKELIS